jgi:hypothetical protein
MPAAEKRRWQATAHAEIAQAVAAARAIGNPYRAAEARRQPIKRHRASGHAASGQAPPKVLTAQEVRALLTPRKLLQSKNHDVEMSLRGVLRGFGLMVDLY